MRSYYQIETEYVKYTERDSDIWQSPFLMIKFKVRWCTCSQWRMLLPCGKLIHRSVVVLSPPLSPFHVLFFET